MPAHRQAPSPTARRVTAALCLSAAALLVPAVSAVGTAPLVLSASVAGNAGDLPLPAQLADISDVADLGDATTAARGDLGVDPAMSGNIGPVDQLRLDGLLAQEQLRGTIAPESTSVEDLVRRLHGGEQLQHAGRLGASSAAVTALSFALSQQGKPYLWGGTGPDSWDCSGLTQAAYRAAGIPVPRVAADQAQVGQAVAFADLLPGDLVFFAFDPARAGGIHHVAMYLGNGLVVHAPKTGDVVKVSRLWLSDYAGAVRVTAGVGGGLRRIPGLRPSGTPAGITSIREAAAAGLIRPVAPAAPDTPAAPPAAAAPRAPVPAGKPAPPAAPKTTGPAPRPSAGPKAPTVTPSSRPSAEPNTSAGTSPSTSPGTTVRTPDEPVAAPASSSPASPDVSPSSPPVAPAPAGGSAAGPECSPAVVRTDAEGAPVPATDSAPAAPAEPSAAGDGAPADGTPAPAAAC